jgi:hypothetical protein
MTMSGTGLTGDAGSDNSVILTGPAVSSNF